MMKPKAAHIVIIVSVIAVAVIGGMFSASGMEWYRTALIKPGITPPNWVFPVAWNIIFILGALSAITAWERTAGNTKRVVCWLFSANAILNTVWSLLFFNMELIGAAFVEMFFLLGTIIALIVLLWHRTRISAVLLLPYALWVTFATYLTYLIFQLNS